MHHLFLSIRRINNKTCQNDFRLKMHEKSSTTYSTIDSTMSNSVMRSMEKECETRTLGQEGGMIKEHGQNFP